ncbi:LysR family transcriptional regulator [Parapusillimonas granuli]|uniref:LysR family transcriptional regulator n=1 Tax=Parapusillimonas granuli TaxID=380911 RepID=A0A853G2X6_9BURK|nr:LysR family transcriptional regulator [Parapusillimonas granuli]MBB5216047.1 DNA-binding transcriptional LysR family regulator [Parapusillimonas granuli]MEB2401319.1 LysR family transcriptional regulator [Alcaligenaceae bacterium]NYT50659.1 LysR family transcriptional regulator [Parapusillimonas granuli]
MDVRSLRYFIETVRQQSLTAAARKLDVTQSTISKMIRQLEDEVGEPLLIRASRPLVLTDAGKVVYERGQDVIAAMHRLALELRETQALNQGTLELGMPPMINLLFTQVLKAFRSQYPGIRLVLHEDTGREIERRVARGELEIGMSVLPLDPAPDLESAEVARHAVWALGEPGSFKPSGKGLRLDALRGRPLVLLDDDFAMTRALRRAFLQAGFEPLVAAQSSQWDWTVSMARAGMGLALLPEPFVQRINREGLVLAPIVEPEVHWPVALLWNARYLSHAAQAWLEVSRRVLGIRWSGDEKTGA